MLLHSQGTPALTRAVFGGISETSCQTDKDNGISGPGKKSSEAMNETRGPWEAECQELLQNSQISFSSLVSWSLGWAENCVARDNLDLLILLS